jgi:hypothetical protein
MGAHISTLVGLIYTLFSLIIDSNIPFAAEYVGAGYETGVAPVSGRVNIAAGPATSKQTWYLLLCVFIFPS